jgi:glycosyltransferase involved in cell wall biosynthesis
MKVVIPVVSAAADISGVQRHAINLARCLLQFPEVIQIYLLGGLWQTYLTEICPLDSRLKVELLPVHNTAFGRNHWYYAKLPELCNQRQADIVHLAYPVPVRARSFDAPVVTTLHDMYPFDLPANFGFPKVFFNQRVLLQCLQAVDAVACVSNSTMRRLEGLEPRVALTKSIVIPNAVEFNAAEMTRPATIKEQDRFLLCIAQHRLNKNILLLLQAFVQLRETHAAHAETRLVIVGVEGPETIAIQRFIRTHALQHAVVLLAGLSEGELKWCYSNCTLLVAPSIMEGFGLPVAEGLLAGCRIVCSDIPVFREVGGDACHYTSLDGDAVHHLADAMATTAMETAAAPASMPWLSFEAVGQQYMGLYRSLRQVKRSVQMSSKRQAAQQVESDSQA